MTDELEAALMQAEEALKPFARTAAKWHRTEPDSSKMDWEDSAPTLGECRAAKRALAALKKARKTVGSGP